MRKTGGLWRDLPLGNARRTRPGTPHLRGVPGFFMCAVHPLAFRRATMGNAAVRGRRCRVCRVGPVIWRVAPPALPRFRARTHELEPMPSPPPGLWVLARDSDELPGWVHSTELSTSTRRPGGRVPAALDGDTSTRAARPGTPAGAVAPPWRASPPNIDKRPIVEMCSPSPIHSAR